MLTVTQSGALLPMIDVSWSQQLANAVRAKNVEQVRALLSPPYTMPADAKNANRVAVEEMLTALVLDTHDDELAKGELLLALASYGGFDRRHLPNFIFALPFHQAKQLIQCFIENGVALRIDEDQHGLSFSSPEICTFVKQRQQERMLAYLAYRKNKIRKHALINSGDVPLMPFFYAKRNFVNLNDRIKAKGRPHLRYVCRHFDAALRGKVEGNISSTHAVFKDRLNEFSSREKAEKKLNAMGYNVLDRHSAAPRPNVQCSNTEFGNLIYNLAGLLKEGEAINAGLVFSASVHFSHAATLHVYKRQGRIGIGVHDSNVTTNMKHAEYLIDAKAEIAKLTLNAFLSTRYAVAPDTFSVLDVTEQFMEKYAGRLVGQDPQIQANSIWDALNINNAAHIHAIVQQLKEQRLPGDQLVELLTKKVARSHGASGLFMALQNGNSEAITAFKEVLELLPYEQQEKFLPEVLAAKDARGVPGLFMALKNGHHEALTAFKGLLELLPQNVRENILSDLLAAKEPNGTPGLLKVPRKARTRAITAFQGLLELLPRGQQETFLPSLLASKGSDGTPRLIRTLKTGGHAAVTDFKHFIELLLSPQQREKLLVDLLVTGRVEVVLGLLAALKGEHYEAITAFKDVLQLIPEHQRGECFADLLLARNANGVPGLFMLVPQEYEQVISAFTALPALLSEGRRKIRLPELFGAQRQDGTPGFFIPFPTTNERATAVFKDVLKLLPSSQRERLLPDLSPSIRLETLGLLTALEQEHEQTIVTWRHLLERLPPQQRELILPDLLAAKDVNGAPWLYKALQQGHHRTIRAFKDFLELLPQNQWEKLLPELLAAKGADGTPGLQQALRHKHKAAVLAFADMVQSIAGKLSKETRTSLLKTVRYTHGQRNWHTLGVWRNESYYKDLKQDRNFYTQFKAMKAALAK